MSIPNISDASGDPASYNKPYMNYNPNVVVVEGEQSHQLVSDIKQMIGRTKRPASYPIIDYPISERITVEPPKSDWHKQQVADLKKRLNIT